MTRNSRFPQPRPQPGCPCHGSRRRGADGLLRRHEDQTRPRAWPPCTAAPASGSETWAPGVLKRAKRRGWIAANPSEDVERITVKRSGVFNVLRRSRPWPAPPATRLRGRPIHVRRAIGHFGVGAPKSGKVRSVPLIDRTAKALDDLSRREHLTGAEDAVLCNVVGKPLRDDELRKGLYDALHAAGLGHLRDPDRQPYPFRFHGLNTPSGP